MADKKGTKRRLWIIVAAAAVIGLILLSSGPDSGVGGLCLMKVAADKAPVRSGPGVNYPETGTLPAGMVIQANRVTSHDFREVPPNRWVAERHLDPVPGSNCI